MSKHKPGAAGQDASFYIGWMNSMPLSYARLIRISLAFLVVLVVALGVLLALYQKPFSGAVFEYGKSTTLEGRYYAQPLPHLLVTRGPDSLFVPLVGYGKKGAASTIAAAQQLQGGALEGRMVKMKGTLLYGSGKLLLQVNEFEKPILQVGKDVRTAPLPTDLGAISQQGEVIDPKCYFGVMKPGEGKVHKDCAIRCIQGGIPPVLAHRNEKGEVRFMLLADAAGQSLADRVTPWVARPAQVQGRLFRYADWDVLYLKEIGDAHAASVVSPKITGCAAACCKH
jgi:hypothetical protein